jgi:hypothetical protein
VMRKDYGDSNEMKSSLQNECQIHPQDKKKKLYSMLNVKSMLIICFNYKSWVHGDFILEVTQWIRNSAWPLYSMHEMQCEWNSQNFGGNIAGFFTVRVLLHTQHCASGSSYEKQNLLFHSPYLLPTDFFLSPKLKISYKELWF